MGQTRMFRDRVVSMEQTFEGGEKHLPLLKDICSEAFPAFTFREHVLEHERDLFVMEYDAPDGIRRRVCWTRMVLFDAERIPTLTADPAAALRAKIVGLLREQAARPEILITFRHLEEGWVDTPEPRRAEGRRRRRGGRGGRAAERPAGAAGSGRPGGQRDRDRERRPAGGPRGGAPAQPQRERGPGPQRERGSSPQGERDPQPRRERGLPPQGERGVSAGERGASPQRPGPDGRPAPPGATAGVGSEAGGGGKRRRRRRRRGGRGPGAGPSGSGAPPAPQGPKP